MPRRRRSTLAWAAVAGLAMGAFALAALSLGERPPPPRPAAAEEPAKRTLVIGRSVRGRPLRAVAIGSPRPRRRVLVVGCLHGNECAGREVTRRLAAGSAPAGTELWLVDDANPDGSAAGTRQNARGVDLNRNFPHRWRRLDRRGGVYWSGPGPLSEPESRALHDLILRIRPQVTIWYHQRMALVDVPARPSAAARRYADLVALPPRHLTSYPGSATTWQNARLPSEGAFVVELPDGALSAPAAERHVRAVLALAGAAATPARAAPAAAERPPIVQRRIPFGARRRAETAAYSARHYGRRTWRLESPAVIVQHFSVTDSADAVYETFARDRRDPELGELPGTCAHFVVDRGGAVQQLVDVGTICRHTLGLNHTAIGIEHVGRSDRAVMGNPRQLAASLRLTRWLRCRHGIATRDVIGHAESLSSRHFLERVPGLDDWTHSDFAPAAMRAYRRRLAAMPCGPPDAREAAEAPPGAG